MQPNIPDLFGLRDNSIFFAAQRYFNSAGPKDYTLLALLVNFIRLVDLAVHEYQSGRNSICEFYKTHESSALFDVILGSGHFETCITSVKRSMEILKTIKSHKAFQNDYKDNLPKGMTLLKGTAETQITNMRNAVHHIERDLRKGEIQQGKPIFLSPTQDKLELGENSIFYNELSIWIKELHDCASNFCKYYTKNFPHKEKAP